MVHYWSDLQSVHGLHCYGKITQTRNVSKYMLVLALCLVDIIKEISVHVCVMICHLSTADELVVVLQLITDESIIAMSENCVGLRCLGVSRCSRLTDAALVALGQTCTELQYVL